MAFATICEMERSHGKLTKKGIRLGTGPRCALCTERHPIFCGWSDIESRWVFWHGRRRDSGCQLHSGELIPLKQLLEMLDAGQAELF